MAEEVTIRLGRDGNPIHALDATHVEVSGAPNWDFVEDEDNPSATAENVYYLKADGPGTDDGRSHFFSTSADGDHEWDGYIFPLAGSYTVQLMRVMRGEESEDQEIATEAVTVEE